MSAPFLGMRLGILGGGQLSQMLASAAQRMGFEVIPFCKTIEDPAAQICPKAVLGSIQDEASLERFFSQVQLVAYENDFLPYELLRKFERQVSFLPQLSVLELVRDKIEQKKLLASLEIPSAPFAILDPSNLLQSLQDVQARFQSEIVIKWAREGYDGKGVRICDAQLTAEDVQFCNDALKSGRALFVEKKIKCRRELALISCLSTKGEFTSYPLVISEQKNGICKKVTGPATTLGVASHNQDLASSWALKIAQKLQLVGTFAIEFFEDQNGKLLVNELAPRVHNSGHFSLDAAATSQFENHWRALLGLPLGSTLTSAGFAMVNILGSDLHALGGKPIVLPALAEKYFFHWYGKKELKPGRKLAHLNAVSESIDELPEIVQHLEAIEEEWLAQFQLEQ